jgi:hypothetical protein
METENLWNKYFEASKFIFTQNSDLNNFKSFVEDSYTEEEIKKFLPRLIELIPFFDLQKTGKLIDEFLHFSKYDIYMKIKNKPQEIFTYLTDDLEKKDKKHIYNVSETKELLIDLHGELSILFVGLKELHKFFKVSIRRIQKKFDYTKISSTEELFKSLDANLCLLAYDTFIDWIVCNKKYMSKIIPLLEEKRMNFCVATVPYNFYDIVITKISELYDFTVKKYPEFI